MSGGQKIRPDMVIGKNIQIMRYLKELTQEEVVAQMQMRNVTISKGSYVKIENDRANIKVSELFALKEIFGLDSFDPFFFGIDINQPRVSKPAATITD